MNKGSKRTEEAKKKIREKRASQIPAMLGKKHSFETKRKSEKKELKINTGSMD